MKERSHVTVVRRAKKEEKKKRRTKSTSIKLVDITCIIVEKRDTRLSQEYFLGNFQRSAVPIIKKELKKYFSTFQKLTLSFFLSFFFFFYDF